MGRLYKLIKLTRLIRVFKMIRDTNKFMKFFKDLLSVTFGLQRLIFFCIILFMMCHIGACLWVLFPQFVTDDPDTMANTWIKPFYDEKMSDPYIYWTSFYWMVQTITTVGYGEFNGVNSAELVFQSFFMILGVVSFSFANGSFASIISNYDSHSNQVQRKLKTLSMIQKRYDLPKDIYFDCKQFIEYNQNDQDYKQIQHFIDKLPQNLMIQMTVCIHEARYKRINFFQDKSKAFISWICPLLKPVPFGAKQYIFREGDDVENIYFLIKGQASFVIPRYENTRYIHLNVGHHFGIIDIIGCQQMKDFDIDDWIKKRNLIQRQFTIMSNDNPVEVLLLDVIDFHKMRQEFYDCYEEIFYQSIGVLRISLHAKLRALRQCRKQLKEFENMSDKSDKKGSQSSHSGDEMELKSDNTVKPEEAMVKQRTFVVTEINMESIDENHQMDLSSSNFTESLDSDTLSSRKSEILSPGEKSGDKNENQVKSSKPLMLIKSNSLKNVMSYNSIKDGGDKGPH